MAERVEQTDKEERNKRRRRIEEQVHKLYWEEDINCARTTLLCLGQQFGIDVEKQTLQAAIGLHGAGGYRAQCGLVEGALMFIGIYFSAKGKNDGQISNLCYRYADAFITKFGSLKCRDLRPGGFSENDPLHLCEEMTCSAILFACEFVEHAQGMFRG